MKTAVKNLVFVCVIFQCLRSLKRLKKAIILQLLTFRKALGTKGIAILTLD
jgi:hypothetical protein